MHNKHLKKLLSFFLSQSQSPSQSSSKFRSSSLTKSPSLSKFRSSSLTKSHSQSPFQSHSLSLTLSLTLSLILFLSILSLSLTTLTKNAEANMFNKFKKGFYFEKYKTAEEAKAALLELHPIGSDVEALVKTLEGAGGMEDTPKNRNDNGGWNYITINNKEIAIGNLLSFRYRYKKYIFFPVIFSIIIEKNWSGSTKIDQIYVGITVDIL